MNAMNAENSPLRPGTSPDAEEPAGRATRTTGTAGTAGTTGTVRTTAAEPAVARRRRWARVHDADGMAVASFVLGLAGLLVFNLILGPCALVLAGLALWRGTTRRTRALLGLGLGAADLIVLAVVSTGDHAASWSITG